MIKASTMEMRLLLGVVVSSIHTIEAAQAALQSQHGDLTA